MTRDAAAAECRAFSRYLANAEPSSYATEWYARLLPSADRAGKGGASLIERSLLAAARRGGTLLRFADAYARFFAPRSLLRRRLVLALGIFENAPGTERILNSGTDSGPAAAVLRVAWAVLASGICIVAGTLMFGPIHLASRSSSGDHTDGAAS